MPIAHRLRKFATAEQPNDQPRMIWCRWFRTKSQAQDYAAADCADQVIWIGDAALSEDCTYDIKRFEVNI